MAGYHAHFVGRASAAQRHHLSDGALLVHIKAIHAETRGGYGWQRWFRKSEQIDKRSLPLNGPENGPRDWSKK